MSISDNIETVRRFYESGPALDDQGRYGFATPDVVWHVPGQNPVSGRYEGAEQVFRVMAERMQPLDRWEIEVLGVAGNDDFVLGMVRLTAERADVRVVSDGGHVFRFTPQGAIEEAWGFVVDQAELDRLLSS
jgi:uncharacterized protein